MMTGVEVYNAAGVKVASLPVTFPDSRVPYLVKEITGLEPVKADIITTKSAVKDGTILQASSVGERNIVMRLGYRPDYLANQSTQSLRREMYTYFPPKATVKLLIIDDNYETVSILGSVESHEPVIFSDDPEVQISILCPDPYFASLSFTVLTNFTGSAVNPSYFGTADTGFLFEIFINRDVSSVGLQVGTAPYLRIAASLIANDILTVSTLRGDKRITLVRSGASLNLLDNITEGMLNSSINSQTSSVLATASGAGAIPYRITFTPKHIGI